MRDTSPAVGGLIFATGFVVLFAYLLGDGSQLMDMVHGLLDSAAKMFGDTAMIFVHFIAWLSGAK